MPRHTLSPLLTQMPNASHPWSCAQRSVSLVELSPKAKRSDTSPVRITTRRTQQGLSGCTAYFCGSHYSAGAFPQILSERHVITVLPTSAPSPASLPFVIEDKGCEVTATRPVSHPVITPDAVGVNNPFDNNIHELESWRESRAVYVTVWRYRNDLSR